MNVSHFNLKKKGGTSKGHYNELVMILLIDTLLYNFFMYFFIDNVCLPRACHVIHLSPSIKLSPFTTFTSLLSPLGRLRGFLRVKCLLDLCFPFASHFDFCTRQPFYSINSLNFVALLKAVRWHDPSKQICPCFNMEEHATA